MQEQIILKKFFLGPSTHKLLLSTVYRETYYESEGEDQVHEINFEGANEPCSAATFHLDQVKKCGIRVNFGGEVIIPASHWITLLEIAVQEAMEQLPTIWQIYRRGKSESWVKSQLVDVNFTKCLLDTVRTFGVMGLYRYVKRWGDSSYFCQSTAWRKNWPGVELLANSTVLPTEIRRNIATML
jgi:hypothetical protein